MVDTPSDSPPNDKHLDERLELKPKGQLECEILGPKTTKINTAPPEAVFSSLFRGFGNIIYKALNWTTVSSLSESDAIDVRLQNLNVEHNLDSDLSSSSKNPEPRLRNWEPISKMANSSMPRHSIISLNSESEMSRSLFDSTSSFPMNRSKTPTSMVRLKSPDESVHLNPHDRPNTASEEKILTDRIIQTIHPGIPARFRLCSTWNLIYSTVEHGFSLQTLYANCRTNNDSGGPTILAIKDTNGGIFGVFSNEPWKPHFGHYGTGECFLWKVDRVPIESEEKFIEIIKYAPTGQDSQFMISEVDFLASGCSDGRFGLWIDAQLLRGHSLPVSTFQNEPLSCTDEFELAGVEVWGLAVPDGSRRFS